MEHSQTVPRRKLGNFVMEMDRIRIKCLGFCEVKWTENGQFLKNGKTVICSGGRKYQRGVALILDRRLSKFILACRAKSDRSLLVKLKACSFKINLIVAYTPI